MTRTLYFKIIKTKVKIVHCSLGSGEKPQTMEKITRFRIVINRYAYYYYASSFFFFLLLLLIFNFFRSQVISERRDSRLIL